MKWLRMTVLSVLCVGLSGQVSADQDQAGSAICGGYLEPDRLFGDKTNVYDRNGHRIGEMREDPLFMGRTNIYDRDGRLNGYLEQDRLKMR